MVRPNLLIPVKGGKPRFYLFFGTNAIEVPGRQLLIYENKTARHLWPLSSWDTDDES